MTLPEDFKVLTPQEFMSLTEREKRLEEALERIEFVTMEYFDSVDDAEDLINEIFEIARGSRAQKP